MTREAKGVSPRELEQEIREMGIRKGALDELRDRRAA